MEAKLLVQRFQPCTWECTEKMMRRPKGFIPVFHRTQKKQDMFMMVQFNRRSSIKLSSSLKCSPGSLMDSGSFSSPLDDPSVLKNKAREIQPFLNGCSIYLVGMMGSGKTTIGRILSEALGYSFVDSDLLVEETVGGMSVAEIFQQYGESFFREKEAEVLQKLSAMHRQVVSTGGGTVSQPINWKHMQKGISIWLDVPLDCLARRISAVGTSSRPLLHAESGDAYSKALTRLSLLFQERGDAYANATVRVSLQNVTEKLGLADVNDLSPVVIAVEVLEQIESFLKEDRSDIGGSFTA